VLLCNLLLLFAAIEVSQGAGGVVEGSCANAFASDDGLMPTFVPVEDLFKGRRHFDQEIVILCVRWYLSYQLSYRNLVAMMGERGIGLAHSTILRWSNITPRNSRSARADTPGL
jgi:hypothetical protein